MSDIEVKNWTVRSSGGRMSIKGVNVKTGEPLHITKIEQIAKVAPRRNPIAIKDDSDTRWVLL